jgi:toxin ParE1/3/4
MTGRALLSPRAQRDIDDIWTYTAEHWGTQQAAIYVCQIGQHMALIAASPTIGQACLQVRSDIFRFPSGSHVLFYQSTLDGVDVVRILHA